MDVTFMRITNESLPAFLIYILPQAAALFVANSDIVSIGAVIEGHTCGAAVCSCSDGVLTLESIFVDETTRRLGLGSELLRRVIDEAKAHWGELYRIKVKYSLIPEQAAEMEHFLLSFGFDEPLSYGKRTFIVRSEDIRDLDYLGSALKPDFVVDPHIVTYSALSAQQRSELENDSSIPVCLKPSSWEGHVLGQGSSVWVEDGHPMAYLLVYQGFDGELVMGPSFKRAGAPRESYRQVVLAVISRSYYIFCHECLCHIHTITDHMADLVERFTAGRFTEYLCRETSMPL